MKAGLSLRTSQQLALTPQLQQAIRLLQLSSVELAGEVEQMLDENPFLERDDDDGWDAGAGDAAHGPADAGQGGGAIENEADAAGQAGDGDGFEADAVPETATPEDWGGDGSMDIAADDGEWAADSGRGPLGDGEDMDAGERAAPQPSLAEHLHRQALALRLSPEDMAALRFLIESLNDDGYLEESLAQLAASLAEGDADDDDELEQLQELVGRFAVALKLLQTLEPAGVGARNLPECLSLQIAARLAQADLPEAQRAPLLAARKICAQPGCLDLLARRDAKKLAQLTGEGEDAVRAAMQQIARLDPKPARAFAQVERNVIVPDVIVTATGGGSGQRLAVRINPDVMPRLRVQEMYASALRGDGAGGGGPAHQQLGQRLQQARWFIKNIQQRFDTILRVSQAIVQRQRAFFIHGDVAMRPMVQRELAEELGLHESTISRVTTAKYMATPRGTFELKHFFASALAADDGGNASSTAVRALIRQLIAAEDAAHPLSDGQIADLLKDQGIDCARRTVAKYREALRIPTASLRKAARAP